MNLPQVSVICLCYNQGRFVREAIESVLNQTYKSIQLIIVDDASEDDSVAEIEKILDQHPTLKFISLKLNQGNCKAFNTAFALATGDYIIDFAADDVMVPHRIERQVEYFETLDKEYGVVFTDATYVDEHGGFVYNHVENLRRKKIISDVPHGDIYDSLISTYFISTPTMMIRREVLVALQGYDEALAYEDFDFWVRSSRIYKYSFLDERLTKVRISKNSMSTKAYKANDRQLFSTYLVCLKIAKLNRNEVERQSLIKRLRYELKQSVFSSNNHEASLFYEQLIQLSAQNIFDHLLIAIKNLHLPFVFLRKIYGLVTNRI